MLSVILLNVANKPFKVSVIMLNVIMMSVVAPFLHSCDVTSFYQKLEIASTKASKYK
jgi:hypothetical protein